MDGWIANGGVGSRGGRVARLERLRQLSERLDEMEYGDDGGWRSSSGTFRAR